MTSTQRPSIPALLAVGAFGALSLLGGWLIVNGSGFYASNSKYSHGAVFISGLPALLMAMLQFLAGALAFTWLLQHFVSRQASYLLGFGLAFAPPMLFVILGQSAP